MYEIICSALLFVATIGVVIWQPRGLSIGWPAAGGALVALAAGIVSLHDVLEVTGIVWNATLTFIAIIIYSVILDEIGFFEWAALHMVRLAGGNGRRLYLYTILLGAAVSCFFANDGAALILTPIVLAQVRALRFPERMVLAFVMASGFISDTTSIPLVISNLVNIVSADYFGIGFVQYAARMLPPNLFSLAASVGMLYLVYRKDIPDRYDLDKLGRPSDVIKDKRLFGLSWAILSVLLAGFLLSEWVRVPVSFVAIVAACWFVAAASRTGAIQTKRILKEAPWTIVVFSIGMYLVVYGLRNAGLTDLLGTLITTFSRHGMLAATLGMGYLSAGLSSVMNNLPSVMIGALAVNGTGEPSLIREALAYANVIGCDLGPKMTPIGSLATLIWLHVLAKRDIRITWGYYFKRGLALTLPTLLVTLLGLYVSLRLAG